MEEKKVMWKCYYSKLLNVENAWDIEGLFHADPTEGPAIQVDSSRV